MVSRALLEPWPDELRMGRINAIRYKTANLPYDFHGGMKMDSSDPNSPSPIPFPALCGLTQTTQHVLALPHQEARRQVSTLLEDVYQSNKWEGWPVPPG